MSASAVNEKVGGRILEARNEAGLSQTELADEVGFSASTVGRWEAGKATISVPALLALSRSLGKPVCFFLQDLADDQWRAQWLSKWAEAEENGERTEMGVRLKDLVEAAPHCEIYVQVGSS
jgi:transcriptional regulator with XRE-family HTH domain